MKLNEVMSAIEEWKNKLREAQDSFNSADDWESQCYSRVLLYERECYTHPKCKSLSDTLMNEVYPEYNESYKARKEAEEKVESAERVIDALKELQAALEDWEA